MPLKAIVRLITLFSGDPKTGLSNFLFGLVCHLTPLVNVDLIARSPSGGVLLSWRDDDHFGPGWHIPGGVIRLKELAVNRVMLVAKNEIRLDIDPSQVRLIHLHEHIAMNKVRGHGYALLYEYLVCQSDVFKYQEFDAAKEYQSGEIAWHDFMPDLLIKEQVPLKQIIFSKKIDSRLISSSQAIFY